MFYQVRLQKQNKNELNSHLLKNYSANCRARSNCWFSSLLYFICIDDAHWNGARRRNRPLPLPSASSDSGVVDIADLNQLLTDLNKHPDSWPFLQPVTRAEVFFVSTIFILASSYSLFLCWISFVISISKSVNRRKYELRIILYRNVWW